MGSPAGSSPQPAGEPELDAQDLASRRRRHRRQLGTVIAVVLIAVGGIGWATDGFRLPADKVLGSIGPQCPPTVTLNGSGSTFVAPLMKTWAEAYSGAAASREMGCVVVQPVYNASGVMAALGRFSGGGTEFVASEEPLNGSAEAALPWATLTLPLTTSAVAIAYNVPGVPAGLNLTGPVLAGIYLGQITTWSDPAIAGLNPGITLPSGAPITVLHDAAGSGTSYVFSGYLSLSNASWASEVGQGPSIAWPVGLVADGDAGAAALLANTSGGIAYLGLAAALAHGLDCARLENPAEKFVAPSAATVFAATTAYAKVLPLGNQSWQNVSLLDQPGNASYPITTFTYAIVFADLGKAYDGALTLSAAQWLAAYLYWMSVAGQSYGTPLGYPPFPSVVTNANTQIVELLKYDGVAALGDIDYDGD